MLGEPEKGPLPGGGYRCPVTIRGLGRERYVYGVDSLQSLMLATVYVNIEINALSGRGYRFFMSKSGGDALDMPLIWQGNGSKMEGLFAVKKT